MTKFIPCSAAFAALLLVLSVAPVAAQMKTNRLLGFFLKPKPDKLYQNRQYYAAAQAYEQELADGKGDAAATQKRIGEAYLYISQPQRAKSWLEQAVENVGDADAWFLYGLALQQTGAYAEAAVAFEQCVQRQPGHLAAQVKLESCRFAAAHSAVNPYVQFRQATEVNTAGGEFGVSLYGSSTVYYSQAAELDGEFPVDGRTGLQYVDTRMTRIRGQRLIYPQATDGALPKYVTDGLFSYDSTARAAYFQWCNPANSVCGIYVSRQEGGSWTDPDLVLANRSDRVHGHPAVANGGRRLYFTSSMVGGIGGTDIWYIDRLDGSRWGTPVNAGNGVNTVGREEFPSVYADTLLFFASDGHVGYGGLDIFCSAVHGNTFSPPVNLRRPYNSPGDDFNIVVTGHTGLLSSSRNEEVSDDLYLFDGVPSFRYFSGHVTDMDTGLPLRNTRLTLSAGGVAVQHTASDSTGYFGFYMNAGEQPMLYTRATGYKPSLTDLPVMGGGQYSVFTNDIQLQPSTLQPATVVLYSKSTGVPVSERGIICYNNDGETQILRTDANGAFRLLMQEDQREYWVKFPDGTFLTESILLNAEQQTYSLAMQPMTEVLFGGWLRFKRGSVEAIEMSQALIPRIASVIRANAGMVFQIAGYCDSGMESREQNLDLRRAEYVVRRLIDEGVDARQLNAVAGERNATTGGEEEADQRRVEIFFQK